MTSSPCYTDSAIRSRESVERLKREYEILRAKELGRTPLPPLFDLSGEEPGAEGEQKASPHPLLMLALGTFLGVFVVVGFVVIAGGFW